MLREFADNLYFDNPVYCESFNDNEEDSSVVEKYFAQVKPSSSMRTLA
jgi:hypothetical protein